MEMENKNYERVYPHGPNKKKAAGFTGEMKIVAHWTCRINNEHFLLHRIRLDAN